ncbi:AraC family transcriptional regulator [Pseudomonas chlororaphis]|uniref:AraC family transcriptional regulator n=1 Tax=Pseudomonas chlororaphis TaxID=587753 RepID=UPI001FF0C71C|nr:AraC family transcriptional regulator [Pseudomonas chlororaphis]
MVHALRERPERLAAVLAEAGIDPALLGQPEARVPASAFAALWLIQICELQDEFLQLDSHSLPPGAFALICRGLIQEPTLEAFAGQVQVVSPSTLRRRLEREGVSYQEIKDEVRRAMAVELLLQSRVSIGEIAECTGFQEPSAFHRVFKKWTGESPGRYRAVPAADLTGWRARTHLRAARG